MAGFEAGSIIARVKADISDFKKGMDDAQGHSSRLKEGIGRLGHGMAVFARGAAIAGGAAAAFGGLAVKEFSDSENSLAQLNAVLKSTKGVAGVTAESALGLADALSRVTKFSDEAILDGENLLLTFTSIGKDVFPLATETMLNMSQALGQDVKSSAVQLGKALQDPILGVTALRRVGVNFNKEQQNTIEKLVESGRALDAQKLILKELTTEFGGSAHAAGQTFSGQLVIAKNTFSNFMETIGHGIVLKIAPLLQKFNDWIISVGGVNGAMSKVGETLRNVWNTINNLLRPAVNLLLAVFDFLRPSLTALWNTIANELWPALRRLWETLGPVLTPVLKFLAVVIGSLLVAGIWAAINALNIIINVIKTVVNWFSNLIHWGRTAAGAVGDAFFTIVPAIKRALSGVWDAVTSPFRKAFDWVGDRVETLKGKLSKLNPFKRDSPSLFDLVSKGTEAVRKQYAQMFTGIGMMADQFRAVNLAPSLVPTNQDNRVNTQIYGNINIGSNVDANNFLARLTRNQELASKGLTTI